MTEITIHPNAEFAITAFAAKHANRERAKTKPHPCRRSPLDVARYFTTKLTQNGECLEWSAGKTDAGYGSFTFWNLSVRAPRFAFAIFHGKAPAQGVLHTCDNPLCCRGDHLFEGDDLANMQDRHRKGRYDTVVKGEQHPRAILTAAQVIEIRRRLKAGESQRALAREFKVERTTIYQIKSGKNWKHIPQ